MSDKKKKPPLDVFAEKLEAQAESTYSDQTPSTKYWEIRNSSDAEVIGDFSQAEDECEIDDENCFDDPWFNELQPDGFRLHDIWLKKTAKLTDVISSTAEPPFGFNNESESP